MFQKQRKRGLEMQSKWQPKAAHIELCDLGFFLGIVGGPV